MVRKRTRTAKSRRNSRKDYESDENESDLSSLDLDSPPSSPAPKRYGLRQRKQPIFCEDFDYDEEDELNANKHGSDDEEYNVEVDLIEVKETQELTRTIRNHSRRDSKSASVSISTIEPEDDALMDDGLIDFEDVIRADVVVNKQRVDYDNIINKTEIQVEAIEGNEAYTAKPVKEKGKRGRKPKPKPLEVENVQVLEGFEGESNSIDHLQIEDDTNVEVQLDPANFVQSESDDSNPPTKSNGVISENNVSKDLSDIKKENPVENGTAVKPAGSSRVNEIEKYVPPELDEKEKEVILSNEYLLANSFDIGADEFLEKQAQKQNEVEEEEENIPVFNFDDDSNSDDDVVIIEKKPEIIVLDDD